MLLTLIIIIAVVSTMASFIIYLLFSYNKRQATLRENFDKELLTAQLEIQEETSLTISRELHDHINGYLIMAKLNLNTAIPLLQNDAKEKAEDTVHLLDYSLDSISRLSRILNKDYIDLQGLPGMLKEHTEWLKKSRHYQVSFTIKGEPCEIAGDIQLMLFRILQETISNIIKHAQAKAISLSLTYTGSYLTCTISDNGIGFNVQEKLGEKHTSGSSGLQNIQRRAKMINALCDITSSHQNGTTICITTPLNPATTGA